MNEHSLTVFLVLSYYSLDDDDGSDDESDDEDDEHDNEVDNTYRDARR